MDKYSWLYDKSRQLIDYASLIFITLKHRAGQTILKNMPVIHLGYEKSMSVSHLHNELHLEVSHLG